MSKKFIIALAIATYSVADASFCDCLMLSQKPHKKVGPLPPVKGARKVGPLPHNLHSPALVPRHSRSTSNSPPRARKYTYHSRHQSHPPATDNLPQIWTQPFPNRPRYFPQKLMKRSNIAPTPTTSEVGNNHTRRTANYRQHTVTANVNQDRFRQAFSENEPGNVTENTPLLPNIVPLSEEDPRRKVSDPWIKDPFRRAFAPVPHRRDGNNNKRVHNVSSYPRNDRPRDFAYMGRELGRGDEGAGIVYECKRNRNSNTVYAEKVLDLTDRYGNLDAEKKDAFESEVAGMNEVYDTAYSTTLSKFKRRWNISPKVYEAFIDTQFKGHIIMDKLDKPQWREKDVDLTKREKRNSEQEQMRLKLIKKKELKEMKFAEVRALLNKLKSIGWLIMDVHDGNIMEKNGQQVLIDFGLAVHKKEGKVNAWTGELEFEEHHFSNLNNYRLTWEDLEIMQTHALYSMSQDWGIQDTKTFDRTGGDWSDARLTQEQNEEFVDVMGGFKKDETGQLVKVEGAYAELSERMN